ncbi:9574_t:CDS:1, partial [Dentiscutata erythropus]
NKDLPKRVHSLEEESSSESEKNNITANISNSQPLINKKKKTKPFGEVQNYFKRGVQKSNGYYEATCDYCDDH